MSCLCGRSLGESLSEQTLYCRSLKTNTYIATVSHPPFNYTMHLNMLLRLEDLSSHVTCLPPGEHRFFTGIWFWFYCFHIKDIFFVFLLSPVISLTLSSLLLWRMSSKGCDSARKAWRQSCQLFVSWSWADCMRYLQYNIFMIKCLLQKSVSLTGSLVKAKNSLPVAKHKVKLSFRRNALWLLGEERLSGSW